MQDGPRLRPAPPRPTTALPPSGLLLPQPLRSSHEDIHATVSLPSLAARAGSFRPGQAVRSTPPVPPPRPESTISAWTRDIGQPSNRSSVTAVAALPSLQPAALLQPLPSPNISLTSPRPGQERNQNLYVDAPLKPEPAASFARSGSIVLPQSTKTSSSSRSSSKAHLSPSRLSRSSSTSATSSPSVISASSKVSTLKKQQQDFSVQPTKKSPVLSDLPSPSADSSSSDDLSESIFCRECGLCRCDACRTPRRLPDKWLCDDSCHLSADSLVDTLSCMCVVKAAMYHFGKDCEESEKGKSGFDNPCSCSADHACARFACVGAASLALPCLCCYLPMRACVRGAERLHERATTSGCRCGSSSSNNNTVIREQPTSLDTSTSSSSAPSSPADDRKRRDSEKRLMLA